MHACLPCQHAHPIRYDACRYVEVDEEHGARLFYYFIESERNPAEDPLILWITGGPGCSALSGLLFEIGQLINNNNYIISMRA
jgi:carboxypeptidase C (cathepsin A)